jgi:probable HAF family extracellular repeat protein
MKCNFAFNRNWCGLFGTLAFAVSASGATYSVQDLGVMTDLMGRSDGRPNGISSDGKVSASNVTNGAYRAFVYDNGWTNLGTLGGDESLGADVNHSGWVAGTSRTTEGLTRAFLWTPAGTDGVPGNPRMKDLGTLGGSHSEAYSINSSGQVSGYSQTTGSGDHAVVWTDGNMTDVGALLGGSLPNSYGLSINEAGHVAGLAYNNSFNTEHAFFYDGTTAVDIGDLGGNGASALSINNSDRIAGYSAVTNGFDHAFRYFNGVMTDLGTLGGNYSYGIGMNNSNVVVGGSFVDDADTIYHAFVAAGNSMTDLNNQLDASGAGWTLIEARDINDAGQIVGIGELAGSIHAFLLNPVPSLPVPAITDVRVSGSDILVRFASSTGATYRVEGRTNLVSGSWNQVGGNIPGTGGVVTVTNLGAASMHQQFYRLGVVAP